LIEALSASVGHPGGAVDGVIVPRLSNDGSPNAKRLDFDDVNEVVGFNFIHHENTYPSWMRLNFNPAPPETSADIIDTLSALPAIQISFLASPERHQNSPDHRTGEGGVTRLKSVNTIEWNEGSEIAFL